MTASHASGGLPNARIGVPASARSSHARSSSCPSTSATPVGPACEELGGEPRLERLHRSARLEPGDAVGEWHAQHRRPRSLVRRLDRADRIDVRADPVFGCGAVHVSDLIEPNAHPASNTEGRTADRRGGQTVAQVR